MNEERKRLALTAAAAILVSWLLFTSILAFRNAASGGSGQAARAGSAYSRVIIADRNIKVGSAPSLITSTTVLPEGDGFVVETLGGVASTVGTAASDFRLTQILETRESNGTILGRFTVVPGTGPVPFKVYIPGGASVSLLTRLDYAGGGSPSGAIRVRSSVSLAGYRSPRP